MIYTKTIIEREIMEEKPLFQCDELLKHEPHCHNNKGQCIQFIEDCKDHALICFSGCHQRCKCQKEKTPLNM